jgi:protein SCO1
LNYFVQKTLTTILLVFSLGVAALGQMGGMMESPPANVRPPGLLNVGVEQRLNQQIPADLRFNDEYGNPVTLGQYFGKRPLILNLVYYQCPMLCGEVLSGLTSSMKILTLDVGKDFDVLTVSFNPKETPAMAADKKQMYLQRYGRQGADQGWHFLTGSEDSIASLTKAAGFQYQYDPKSNQYAHATAIMVLTPGGKISQYFYGVEFAPKDLRLGLVQASNHQIGTVVDEVLLYCYHYDPQTGKYSAMVSRILKLAGAVTIVLLGGLLLVMFRLGPSERSGQVR